jgi:molybdopterin-binding protein
VRPQPNVWIDVGGQTITASITNEAVDELKARKGQNSLRRHQGDQR